MQPLGEGGSKVRTGEGREGGQQFKDSSVERFRGVELRESPEAGKARKKFALLGL